MAIKRLKNGSFFVFSADDSKKMSHNLGKLFKCIWKLWFSSSRKCYEKEKKKKKENIPQKEKRESMNRIKGIIINIWTHFQAEEEEEEKKERN